FDRCYPPCSFGIPRSYTVPDAPDVFPTLPTHSAEERKLQDACLVLCPAVADVDHVASLEPLVTVHHRNKGKSVLAPCHDVPAKRFIVWSVFGLKGERMPDLFCGERKTERYAILCITVDPICIDLLHEGRNCIGPRLRGLMRALIPHHHGKEHAHATLM